MIVGEGRAGKTALANSIIGNPFAATDSTIGIEQFSCCVNYADASKGHWKPYDRPEKEYETAIAQIIKEVPIKSEPESQANDTNLDSDIDNKNENATILFEDSLTPTPVFAVSAATIFSPVSDAAISSPAVSAAAAAILEPKPIEIDNDYVAKCLADNIETSSDLIISLFDFGGQSVFDVIHHLFLTPYGVYLVVFNMTWLSDRAAKEEKDSCISRLKRWVNSIIIHTTNSQSYKSAPIVFVGTHKDQVSDLKSIKTISNTISSVFGSIRQCWESVIQNDTEGLCFFPVNNVEGRDEGVFPDMLQKIEDRMKSEDYVTKERPLSWLQALDELKGDKSKSFYTAAETYQILGACGIEEKEYKEVLELFSKMGELLWIDEDGLRDVVIIDPITFFVTPATRMICKHVESEERGKVYRHENHMLNTCQLKYPVLWETMVARELLVALLGVNHEVVLTLMIKFGLLVQVTKEDQEGGKLIKNNASYLIPSLLPPEKREIDSGVFPDFLSTPAEIHNSFLFAFKLEQSVKLNSLEITQLQSEGFMPNGLFVRFLVKLLDWSQLSTEKIDILADHLSQNDITIVFGDRRFRLRLLEDWNGICITVIRCKNYVALLERLRGIMTTVIHECFASLCWEVMFLRHDDDDSKSWYLIPYYSLSRDSEIYQEYANRWKLRDTTRGCDVFLSYRWGGRDQKFVSLVYDALLDYDYEYIFLDIKVIEDDYDNIQEIQEIFTKALIRSEVFVPFVSQETLRKMKSHNPELVDNVLLEWLLALDCHQQEKLSILSIPYSHIDEIYGLSALDRGRGMYALAKYIL